MRNKKAFTVVELVIVIAIIAILAAVLIPTFANIIKKANVSKDQQLIRNLNTALASDRAENGGKNHRNMTEALAAAEKFGYEVSKINASGTDNEILWDSKNDLFCYFDGNDIKYIPESVLAVQVSTAAAYETGKVNDVDYWVIRNVTDTTATGENKGQISAKYSTYLAGLTGTDATLVVTKGIDVGTNVVASVKYENTTAQEATIVTNGEPLEINAPNDTINHFGEAESVNIIDVKSDSSYHEFGTVPFIQIKSGRLVLEDTADVNGIHLVKTENGSNVSFDDIVLNFGGKTVKLTRDPIGTALGDTLMLVCKVEGEGGDEYIWLKGNGTFDSENVYVSSTPNASDATKISEGSASYAAKAVANYLDGSDVVDGGKDVAAAKAASALKGSGTAEDPFLIYDYATMQKISEFYDEGYYYFEVALDKTDNGKIDCAGWVGVNMFGSFDGKGVVFKNLDQPLFNKVNSNISSGVVLKNFRVDNCFIMTGSYYVGAVLRVAYHDVKMEDISISGYLEANSPASFIGQGNFYNTDCNISFVRCHSSMNLVSLNAQCGGFTGNLFGNYYNKDHQCLVSLVDSYFDGSLAVASGSRFSYVECHTAAPIKYSISYTNEVLENQCSSLYSTGHTEAKDVSYLGSTKTITKGTITLPGTGESFSIAKTASAVSAKAYLIVGLNPGNFTAIFVSEEIDLSGVTESFSTSKVKNYNVVVNDGTHNKTEIIGDTLYIYDSRYEPGYGSLTFMVVQYDSLGGIVSVSTKSK